jgi:serine phosphatase RsbU (regulator of sigma subunit)
VGGDDYDFLSFGEQRLTLVIGDVAGKGIAAALQMANLQANLRSQCAVNPDQAVRAFESVNQLFYGNTTEGAYVTLFLLNRTEKISACATPIAGTPPDFCFGATARGNGWTPLEPCSGFSVNGMATQECSLSSGDTFAIYTGLTESLNDAGEEFYEQPDPGPEAKLRAAPAGLAGSIVDDAKNFSASEQSDHVTLIVGKVS